MGDLMDEYLIVKGAQQDAQDDLNAFENLARIWWPTQGYPVEEDGIIPRNAATGDLDFTAQRTVAWDTLREAPDGDYYWTSPTPDARFYQWKDYLAQSGYTLKCVEVAKDWIDEEAP